MSKNNTGDKNGFFNHSHSEETKIMIRNKNKGKRTGSNNTMSKKVRCIELNIDYNSITEASKSLNICKTSIGLCCSNVRNTAGKMHWCYL